MFLFLGVFIQKALLVLRPWDSEDVRSGSFLWWCAPSNKQYNTADEDEQTRTIQDMAERLARLEQSLIEVKTTMKKDAVPLPMRAGVSQSRWR